MVLGSEEKRFQIKAWANPFDEIDYSNPDKVRAPAAFTGKGLRQTVNAINLNPFAFNPSCPYVTRVGKDGKLVEVVNKWQSIPLDGVKINDVFDRSKIQLYNRNRKDFIERYIEEGYATN